MAKLVRSACPSNGSFIQQIFTACLDELIPVPAILNTSGNNPGNIHATRGNIHAPSGAHIQMGLGMGETGHKQYKVNKQLIQCG